MRTFVCKQCGEEKKMYGVKGPLRMYCDPCRSVRHVAYLKSREQRRATTDLPDLPAFE
jgi:hypothetical protein